MNTQTVTEQITVTPVRGLPEITAGDDLAGLLCAAEPAPADGDVVVVTSKVVSKAEGRVVAGAREDAVTAETVRVVARRGTTVIARTAIGITLAAAGVDASNTPDGTVVLLPQDPDASARALRSAILDRAGSNVAVVVSDTAGRAWRLGQTDFAIGCAGLLPLHDHAGLPDRFGRMLQVTAPAVADELAGAADLVLGKLSHCPAAVVSGLGGWVLPRGDHGPGAAAVVRDEVSDLFGLGAREAVQAAVARDDTPLRAFGATADQRVLEELLAAATGGSGVRLQVQRGTDEVEVTGAPGPETAVALERLAALATAHGWGVTDPDRNFASQRIVLGTTGRPT